MILQNLCDYYDRKQQNPETALAPFGFEEKSIPFVIVLDEQGKFLLLADERENQNGKLVAKSYVVPKAKGRSGAKSYETANCLWDHYGYVVQQPKLDKPDKEPTEKQVSDAAKQHVSFKKIVERLVNDCPEDVGVKAVWSFLNTEQELEKVKSSEDWKEVVKIKGCNLSFRLASSPNLVCQSELVIQWVKKQPLDQKDIKDGFCLVTGEQTNIVRLHGQVAGVNQKPAPLASINEEAYNSFNKAQAFNFPVSVESNFKYTTALNYLLRKSSNTKFRIAETTYVCWADNNNQLESIFRSTFVDNFDDPDQNAKDIKALFDSVKNGAYSKPDGRDKFYVLGLSPNSARISIRFWQVGTIAEFSERIGQWFGDLQIEGVDHYGLPTLKNLLRSIALLNDEKNLPPNLASDLSRAVLGGLPLPRNIIQSVIRRIRAEPGGAKYAKDDYYRVCLIKADINRRNRHLHNKVKEIKMALNEKETRVGYLLGRLFSVLEKLQSDAQGNVNATIRDRYYSSASCTPKAVFGTLLRMHTHHLRKLEKEAFRISVENRITKIMDGISDFPSSLNLENQGLFAIGYYHQKQALYTKKTDQGEEK